MTSFSFSQMYTNTFQLPHYTRRKTLVTEKIKQEIMTFTAGLEPVRASHNIRQESSPTLQNSCALKKENKRKGGCWLNLEKRPRKIRFPCTREK